MGFSDGREKEWEKQAFVRNVIELLEINEYAVRKQPVLYATMEEERLVVQRKSNTFLKIDCVKVKYRR